MINNCRGAVRKEVAYRTSRTRYPICGEGLGLRFWFACGLLAMSECAVAAMELEPEALVPAPGTATLIISGTEAELQIELAAPAITLMGFEQTPRTRLERETFRLAEQNLKTGDALVRFSTQAACRLESAEVDMGEVKRAGSKQLSARYHFVCDQPDLLDSAAVGLFMAFPALDRVFVRYDLMGGVSGAAELNMKRPLVSFVPLY